MPTRLSVRSAPPVVGPRGLLTECVRLLMAPLQCPSVLVAIGLPAVRLVAAKQILLIRQLGACMNLGVGAASSPNVEMHRPSIGRVPLPLTYLSAVTLE